MTTNPNDTQRDAELRARLTPLQYEVTQLQGTEQAFTGEYWDCHDDGSYHCVVCDAPLFSSDTKFESGTGWPSFFTTIPGVFETKKDYFLIYPRIEYHCKRCGGHHGHVFDDGPPPTGQRWCNNGVALTFLPK
jgi:peptide-methionine (R)-S-oxide reductase